MSTIQLGFVLPSEGRDKQNRATLVEDLNNALDLITGHFDSAWMVDHLQFGDVDVLRSSHRRRLLPLPKIAGAPMMTRTSVSSVRRTN